MLSDGVKNQNLPIKYPPTLFVNSVAFQIACPQTSNKMGFAGKKILAIRASVCSLGPSEKQVM